LIVAALCRSHNLPVEGGYPTDPVSYEWFRRVQPNTIGFFVEHVDGFRTSIYLTSVQDFNYAGYVVDKDAIVSCQMYLPMPGHGSSTADFFTPLIHHIEDMVITGEAPYPVERTLLTSGMVIGGVESLHRGQTPVETPEMAVAYTVRPESTFWKV
jgi:hypothetical protein